MSDILTRNPGADDVPLLKNLWCTVFGDIGIDAFFRLFYQAGMCLVVEHNGSLAAMGYLIPSGDIKAVTDDAGNEIDTKCAMIYSVGTLHEYRGLGLGTIIVNDLIKLAGNSGYDAVVLCPSEDGLFEYYNKRTELQDWFYISESVCDKPPAGTPSVLPIEISAYEYAAFREKLLTEVVHIRQDEKFFEYQLDLCNEFGGGLFRIGDSCAVVERQSDGIVWVKELLMHDKGNALHCGYINDAVCTNLLAPIANLFPAEKYFVRTPALTGAGRRFGLLNLCGNVLEPSAKNKIAPWYGMAFD